ncbi:hypothetical protein IF2G_10008 [Cordyceps javanica]|nr:hypothetical protein IF2G_10008 [Cordyceps javanica]
MFGVCSFCRLILDWADWHWLEAQDCVAHDVACLFLFNFIIQFWYLHWIRDTSRRTGPLPCWSLASQGHNPPGMH